MAKRKTKSGSTDGQLLLSNIEQIKALIHPIRQRLFESLAKSPATSKQLADDLGFKPTRLYHHMNTLEKAGLIKLVRTEQIRGTTAKYYEAVASSLRVDPSLLSETGGGAVERAGVGVIDGLLANVRHDVEQLLMSNDERKESLHEEALFMQFELLMDEKKVKRFRKRVDRLVDDLREECEASDTESNVEDGYRFLLCWYPRPSQRSDS